METFKYLNKEGNVHILKGQAGLAKIAILAEIIIGALCIIPFPIFGIIFFVLALLTIPRLKHKIVFDPTNRTITFPKLRNKEGTIYSFDEFTNFKMIKFRYNFILTTSNWLHMEFDKNGRNKAIRIRQYGPSAKKAQDLIDEIEIVMGLSDNRSLN